MAKKIKTFLGVLGALDSGAAFDLDDSLSNNPNFIFKVLKTNLTNKMWILGKASPTLTNDVNFMSKVINQYPEATQYLGTEIMSTETNIKNLIDHLEIVPAHLNSNIMRYNPNLNMCDIIKYEIAKDEEYVNNIPVSLANKDTFMYELIRAVPVAITRLGPDLKNNKDYWSKALINPNCEGLKASAIGINDKMSTIVGYASLYKHIPDDFRNDTAFWLESINTNPFTLQFAPAVIQKAPAVQKFQQKRIEEVLEAAGLKVEIVSKVENHSNTIGSNLTKGTPSTETVTPAVPKATIIKVNNTVNNIEDNVEENVVHYR